MSTLDRRSFLKLSGLALGTAALSVAGLSAYREESVYLSWYREAKFFTQPSAVDRVRLALTNARLVDVLTGRYYDNASTLIIENGKIAAIPGLPGQPENYPADLSLDLGGRAVIPGLFNTHCHLANIQSGFTADMNVMFAGMVKTNFYAEWQRARCLADCLARGITHVRDSWTEDLRINRNLKAQIERGDIPGPRIYQAVLVSQAGGPFAPDRSFMDRMMWKAIALPTIDYEDQNSGVVVFPEDASKRQVRAAIDRAIDERGAEYIKIYDQRGKRLTMEPGAAFMTMEQLTAAAEQARSRGLNTISHHFAVESFRRAVRAGIDTVSHLPMDELLSDEDVTAFVRAGSSIEPTLLVAYAGCWKTPGKPWADLPEMQRLDTYRHQNYQRLSREYWVPQLAKQVMKIIEINEQTGDTPTMEMITKPFANLLTQGLENLGRLKAAGATIACGNDAGAVQGSAAMLAPELELFDLFLNAPGQSPQFSPADLLRTATLQSAQAMGIEHQFGSIEPGKVADLVVLDGDPLADFTLIGSLAQSVFKAGRLEVNNIGLEARSISN